MAERIFLSIMRIDRKSIKWIWNRTKVTDVLFYYIYYIYVYFFLYTHKVAKRASWLEEKTTDVQKVLWNGNQKMLRDKKKT